MAGRGVPPKDPRRRAGHRKDPHAQTVLRFEKEMWKASPQAEQFSSTDWSFLVDTALIHARLWAGDASAGPELRLRVAKFGATPEDRARLRMQFAQADEADGKRPTGASSSERFADLKVLPGGGADAVEGA